MLTAEQLRQRKGLFTASCANVLLGDKPDKVMNMFYEFTEDPRYVAPDLDDVWPVQLGSVTEELNLDWYARRTGNEVTRRGEVVVSPEYDWAACTLDGWDATTSRPVECKHVGGWEPMEKVIARYQPQLHWQMIVMEAETCAISIIEGAKEPVVTILPFAAEYGAALFARANIFMQCVASKTPPIAANDNIPPPVVATKAYDMSGNNYWADQATVWLSVNDAARTAQAAEKTLKMMMPRDAASAKGYGVEITRDRASRLHLRVA